MAKFRMIVGMDNQRSSYKEDFEAENRDVAMNKAIKIALRNGFGYGGYNVTVMEIKDGVKEIGIDFEYRFHDGGRKYDNIMFIKANNESEAISIYNREYKGKRFWSHKPGNIDENGNSIYGKVTETWITCY